MLNNLKTPVRNCIQNVYNLGIAGVKSSAHLSTLRSFTQKYWHTPGYIHSLIPNLSAVIHRQYTHPKQALLNLSPAHLYTLSTGPTITETKEKMERNY